MQKAPHNQFWTTSQSEFYESFCLFFPWTIWGPTLHFRWLSTPTAHSQSLIYHIVMEWDKTVGVLLRHLEYRQAPDCQVWGLVNTWGFCMSCVHSPFWWQHPNLLWGPTTPSVSDNVVEEELPPHLVLRMETWPRPRQSANSIAMATAVGLRMGTWPKLVQWETSLGH